jgi:hypothetical protein
MAMPSAIASQATRRSLTPRLGEATEDRWPGASVRASSSLPPASCFAPFLSRGPSESIGRPTALYEALRPSYILSQELSKDSIAPTKGLTSRQNGAKMVRLAAMYQQKCAPNIT